jgi:lipopolysaccharide/colanic/teichoic acid biosynthesis glycosyltransferase
MSSYQIMKRTVDLLVGIAALPFAAPLCILLMILIRIESPGSPLFIQKRMGRGKSVFHMLKLRTMAADIGDHPSHELGGAHITRLGGILRRLKLDELPQLLNVVAGSMSLVGPRPCLPSQLELIDERSQRGIFAFRPGVTGPAQVEGVDMSEPRRVAEIEARYFVDATIARDFVILWKTATGSGSGDAAAKATKI